MTSFKLHTFPGMANPVPLPVTLPVSIRIINHSRFRSFQKSYRLNYTTFHDTGNPNTDAEGEYRWAAGGRQGGSVGGYNGIVDDKIFIVTQPFDEVVWAQGVTEGNATSYAIEQAWGGSVNFEKSLENAIRVHAGIIVAKRWNARASIKKHQDWSKKWCPGQVLNKGRWPEVVNRIEKAAEEAYAFVNSGGTPTPPANEYLPAVPIATLDNLVESGIIPYEINLKDHATDPTIAYYVNGEVIALQDTPRLRYSTGTQQVGPPIKKGEKFHVRWLLTTSGRFPATFYTDWATRIRAVDASFIAN